MTPSTHIGFTGTSTSMTPEQQEAFGMLAKLKPHWKWLHHGDCVGADEQAHVIWVRLGRRTVVHPPINEAKRAWSLGADQTTEAKDYLVRNHDIVDETVGLVAVPRTAEEELRSGTWATVRYAKKTGKPVVIIRPDGALVVERQP